jgi:hypothetical protein
MTGPVTLADVSLASVGSDLPPQQEVRYTYWPVNYYLGDPTVTSAAPLPLSGVKFSRVAKGTGELRASLQTSDDDVRAMKPWELVVPRKTGIVVVRTSSLPDQDEVHTIEWHGVVWAAPIDDATGRMEITARTVEYNWAQRLITGPMEGGDLVFAQSDRTFIVQDLLTPELFSQIGPAAAKGSAVAATASASLDRVIINTTDLGQFSIGDYIYVTDISTGLHRMNAAGTTDIFLITDLVNGGGISAIVVSPLFASLPQTGDLVESFDLFPGWITIDPPTVPTGRLHDLTYTRDQQTNLLEAHQDRSEVDDGYDWYTTVRVLEGNNAYEASTYRVQYVMGYPRLGRVYGEDDIPRFSYYVDGRGNAVSADIVYDGSAVRNVMWGAGAGFDSSTLRALTTNTSDWRNGFLITEGRYSNPDVSVASTLQSYTNAALIQTYANERFLKGVTVRGDMPPYFGSYNIGDDALYTTDGWSNPDNPDGTRDTTYLTRIMGWTVTPPEGTNSETIELMLAGGGTGGDIG